MKYMRSGEMPVGGAIRLAQDDQSDMGRRRSYVVQPGYTGPSRSDIYSGHRPPSSNLRGRAIFPIDEKSTSRLDSLNMGHSSPQIWEESPKWGDLIPKLRRMAMDNAPRPQTCKEGATIYANPSRHRETDSSSSVASHCQKYGARGELYDASEVALNLEGGVRSQSRSKMLGMSAWFNGGGHVGSGDTSIGGASSDSHKGVGKGVYARKRETVQAGEKREQKSRLRQVRVSAKQTPCVIGVEDDTESSSYESVELNGRVSAVYQALGVSKLDPATLLYKEELGPCGRDSPMDIENHDGNRTKLSILKGIPRNRNLENAEAGSDKIGVAQTVAGSGSGSGPGWSRVITSMNKVSIETRSSGLPLSIGSKADSVKGSPSTVLRPLEDTAHSLHFASMDSNLARKSRTALWVTATSAKEGTISIDTCSSEEDPAAEHPPLAEEPDVPSHTVESARKLTVWDRARFMCTRVLKMRRPVGSNVRRVMKVMATLGGTCTSGRPMGVPIQPRISEVFSSAHRRSSISLRTSAMWSARRSSISVANHIRSSMEVQRILGEGQERSSISGMRVAGPGSGTGSWTYRPSMDVRRSCGARPSMDSWRCESRPISSHSARRLSSSQSCRRSSISSMSIFKYRVEFDCHALQQLTTVESVSQAEEDEMDFAVSGHDIAGSGVCGFRNSVASRNGSERLSDAWSIFSGSSGQASPRLSYQSVHPPILPTLGDLQKMNGSWRLDRSLSDDIEDLCRFMQLGWWLRKASKALQRLEMRVTPETFRYGIRAFGPFEIGAELPLSGAVIGQPRADGRSGYIRTWLEMRTFGVVVMSSWGEPLSGTCEDAFELSKDGTVLTRKTSIRRDFGNACSMRWVFKRI